MGELLRLIVPEVGEQELAEIARVFDSGLLTQGPAVAEFEAGIARLTGASHAVATTSATSALHVTLAALDIGPDDEVIVPDFTFPATSNVVIQQGAAPVLVDIDLETFNTTAELVAEAVTERTRAIMPVHTFGLLAPMPEIVAIAAEFGIPVIEDAACALGATRHGTPAGRFGLAGCFSFHPRKAITTGEGGMVITSDEALATRIRALRTHGGQRVSGRFVFNEVGFNYRLSDIQAAVGLAQLRKLASVIAKRRELAARYDRTLSGIPGLRAPRADPGHVYQSYVVLIDETIDRDRVITSMGKQDIETTLGTYAVHAQPAMARFGYSPGDLPNSWRAYRSSITLPLHGRMTEADVDRVCAELEHAIVTA
jgi:dTDP-4-amino-4,6-dideoxygalactose transaminase